MVWEIIAQADVPGVEDVGRYASRMWQRVYGGRSIAPEVKGGCDGR